jgi:hypothetical protein
VSGHFAGLVSPATDAHLYLSPAIGVPGERAIDLAVTQGIDGSVSGHLTLSSKQVTAFRTGRLYIQVDSQKAPTGNLWGWLLPEHKLVASDVPQTGHWFIPQLDTPTH